MNPIDEIYWKLGIQSDAVYNALWEAYRVALIELTNEIAQSSAKLIERSNPNE